MGAVVALDGLLASRRVWRGQPVGRPASAPEPTGHAALDLALPTGGWPEHALRPVSSTSLICKRCGSCLGERASLQTISRRPCIGVWAASAVPEKVLLVSAAVATRASDTAISLNPFDMDCLPSRMSRGRSPLHGLTGCRGTSKSQGQVHFAVRSEPDLRLPACVLALAIDCNWRTRLATCVLAPAQNIAGTTRLLLHPSCKAV